MKKAVHPSKVGKTVAKRPSAEPRGHQEPQDIGRSLPYSVEAEQGVLGSMLISPTEVIGECVETIGSDGEWFYTPAHQSIYKILVELWRDKKGIDLITFTQVLRDRNILDSVGGGAAITNLFTFVPTAANVTYYREIVRGKFILRQIIAAGTESVRRAFEEQDEVDALLNEIERKVLSIRPQDQTRQGNWRDVIMDAIENLERTHQNRGAISGLSSGFIGLDQLTSGMHPQDMIVIAGRPSMGKTAIAMNIVEHVAIKERKPVVIFSLEMSERQLATRLLCSHARVNQQKAKDGFLSERDFPALSTSASKIADSPIHIIDDRLYIDVLVAKARRLKADHNIQLVIVDYLQLLRARGFKQDNRQAEVGYISGALKGLAKDLNIPVIVLAQLNRNPENRHGGKPRMSDLRESGAIEQDADLIGLLTRAEVYEDDNEEKAKKSGEAELIVAKQRNGPTGEVYLTFIKEYTRFEDRAKEIQGEL